MIDTPTELQEEILNRGTLRRSENKSKAKPIILIITIVVVWFGLFYLGYWYMDKLNTDNRLYIDAKVEEEINQLQPKFDEVYEEVVNINNELIAINSELSLTSELLYGTDTNKVALQIRIDELNAQLNELQASIERLKDATSN